MFRNARRKHLTRLPLCVPKGIRLFRMITDEDRLYGHNVVANGRNWNALRLLTGLGKKKKGHQLTEIRFKLRETDIMVVLKKNSPKGPQVAFVTCADLDTALYVVASEVKAKTLRWKPDKWVTTRIDNSADS